MQNSKVKTGFGAVIICCRMNLSRRFRRKTQNIYLRKSAASAEACNCKSWVHEK